MTTKVYLYRSDAAVMEAVGGFSVSLFLDISGRSAYWIGSSTPACWNAYNRKAHGYRCHTRVPPLDSNSRRFHVKVRPKPALGDLGLRPFSGAISLMSVSGFVPTSA
jgi:hypothetical protein